MTMKRFAISVRASRMNHQVWQMSLRPGNRPASPSCLVSPSSRQQPRKAARRAMLVLPDDSHLQTAPSGFSRYRTQRPAIEANSSAELTGKANASTGKGPARAWMRSPVRRIIKTGNTLFKSFTITMSHRGLPMVMDRKPS